MRVTQALFRQHIGRYITKHWRVQGKKVIRETSAVKILEEKGVQIHDPKDFLNEERTIEHVEVIDPRKLDPNYHDRACLTYKDANVLLEGLTQAKSLLKTVEIKAGLPEKYDLKNTTREMDSRVKKIIMNAHLFDAEQEKLPKVKDPKRPAFNFPRSLGITEQRRNKLMVSKLLQLIESTRGAVANRRLMFNDVPVSFSFEKSGDLIQFSLTADTLITSERPLKPVTSDGGEEAELPDLFPVKDTVTLTPENVYKLQNLYPISKDVAKHHPHTLFVHYNATEVKNLFETEVTEEQIYGRSLIKAFAVAAAYARQKHGEQVSALPSPITVQCVQTDGRLFHFGVLQLNSLDLDKRDGIKNIWYQTERLPLFTSCSYILGKPTLVDYRSDVIKHLLTFYDNI